MKKIAPIILLCAGLVGTVSTFSMVLQSAQYQLSFTLLLVLWLVSGIVGFVLAENAAKIGQEMKSTPNLTKIVLIPLIAVSLMIYALFHYLPPVLFALFTSSFAILFVGYFLIRRLAH